MRNWRGCSLGDRPKKSGVHLNGVVEFLLLVFWLGYGKEVLVD